jgi:hypothetical protein
VAVYPENLMAADSKPDEGTTRSIGSERKPHKKPARQREMMLKDAQ